MPTFAAPVRLPIWASFRAGDREPSRGKVEIMLHGNRPSAAQKKARASIEKRAAAMQPLLLDAIIAAYPTFRDWNPRPKSVTKTTLRKLIDLREVIVLADQHEKVAYLSYYFSCAWDPSGFHVITHDSRVVCAGGSEVLEYPIADPARNAPKPKYPSPAQRKAAIVRARKAAKKNPKRLDDEESIITLPVWAGFCDGPNSKPSVGEVMVSVHGDGPTKPQQNAYRFLLDRERDMQAVLLDAIVREYPRFKKIFDGFQMKMPDRVDEKSLRDLVAITCAIIHDVDLRNIAYIGYELNCAWDREHAVGLMTHRDRVVEIGSADRAILSASAKTDSRKHGKKR